MKLNDVICLIPARGGSKGIPRKNEQMIGGVPLVVHSIRHAKDAGVPIDQIIVSSDSEAILHLADRNKVVAHRRPDYLSGDEASTESVMLHIADQYSTFNTMLLLQPTSPIRFQGRVAACLSKYFDGDFDSLLTVTPFHDFFWQEKPVDDTSYQWVASYPVLDRPRRQELSREDTRYFDDGNIYITDTKVLKETGCRIGKKPCIFPISMLESMQIDTIDDLTIMNAIFSKNVQELKYKNGKCCKIGYE